MDKKQNIHRVVYKLIYISYIKDNYFYILGNNGLMKVSEFMYNVFQLINNRRTVDDITNIIREKTNSDMIDAQKVFKAVELLEENKIVSTTWKSFLSE